MKSTDTIDVRTIDFHSHEMQNAAFTLTVTREVERKAARARIWSCNFEVGIANRQLAQIAYKIAIRREEKSSPFPVRLALQLQTHALHAQNRQSFVVN